MYRSVGKTAGEVIFSVSVRVVQLFDKREKCNRTRVRRIVSLLRGMREKAGRRPGIGV